MPRPLVRGLVALVLQAGFGLHPALASTVVVPDEFSTVQSAIDSGADTVQIREGTYSERPVVDHPVIIQGIGAGSRPRLDGLDIYNSNFWAAPPLLSVNRVDFTGRVEHTTLYTHPRNLVYRFSACSLGAGIQVMNQDIGDIALLDIRNCHLIGQSAATASQVFMDADTIDGDVSWRTYSADGISISDCWFRGGNVAIRLVGGPRGSVGGNRIEGYATALDIEDGEELMLVGNRILACVAGINVRSGSVVDVSDNDIGESDIGIFIRAALVSIADNSILGAQTVGIWTDETSRLTVERNIVGRCGGPGIQIDRPSFDARVRSNTIFRNIGSGIALDPRANVPVSVRSNIAFENGEWGLAVVPAGAVSLGCNDWFGNGLGAVSGVAGDPTDLSVDPLFCNLDSAEVRLDTGSPLVEAAGCGQIGALGVGCGKTATLVQRFTAGRVRDGIRVVWEVAEGGTASEVWLERSKVIEGGPWSRPLTERSFEDRAVVELDQSAASERAYSYRLVALEGSNATVIGSPIIVEAQAKLEFRLVQVGPNPGSGPVRIAFALEHAAAIEIDVFDVQGRRVASPGAGVWPAGTHAVEWNGLARNGEPVPSGMYLLRYQYPGGQDRRRIVRVVSR